MGKLNYEDVKSYIEYSKTGRAVGYNFPLAPHYNKIVGNIEPAQVTILTGLPAAGTSSFLDQNYVMSVLLQWYNLPVEDRNPLRIFYYSMGNSELKKLQGFLCNYIKLVNNRHVDIPTLNNQAGKLYELSADADLLEAVEDATDFFTEILDNGVLQIQDKAVTPTEIYNDVYDYVEQLGTKTSDGFTYNDEYEHALTLVVVDGTDKLATDVDGYGSIYGDALDTKLRKFVQELKTEYSVSFAISVPSKIGYIRSVKDTEPHIRHIGEYASIADKAVSIYNPVLEKNAKYYSADETLYVTAKGNTLLRTWHVIRNVDGIDSVYNRLFFLPGTSYMIEYDKFEPITDLEDVLEAIAEPSEFHKDDN